jgi:hypothetical protein
MAHPMEQHPNLVRSSEEDKVKDPVIDTCVICTRPIKESEFEDACEAVGGLAHRGCYLTGNPFPQ